MLNAPLFCALCLLSAENGRQTDIQAIPAHIALGSPSSETIKIAPDTIKVSLIYQRFLAENNVNSWKRSKKVQPCKDTCQITD